MTRRPIVPFFGSIWSELNWIDNPFLDSIVTISESELAKLSYDCRIFAKNRAMAMASTGTATWIIHGVIIGAIHRHPSLGPRHREPPPSLWVEWRRS